MLEAVDYFINTDCEKYIQLVIITELAENDLDHYIRSLKDGNIREEDLKVILAQMVIGLSYLHLKQEISHRDFKPQNILMFPGLRIKISDFGLAKTTDTSKASMTVCGTLMFMAPELLKLVRGAKPERFKPDIYSFAATAIWMILKIIPDTEDIIDRTIVFPSEYSQDLKDFIYFCLIRRPHLRPTIADIAK